MIGVITGAIAEAYYGVPADIKQKALGYLDEELRAIYDEWEQFAPIDRQHLQKQSILPPMCIQEHIGGCF